MSDDMQPVSKKSRWTHGELMRMPREDLVEKVLKQINHVEYLMSRQQTSESIAEMAQLREVVDKQRAQIQEGVQRESILVKRLTEKEHDVQDLLTQLQEVKLGQQQSATAQLHARLLDPAVCAVVQRLTTDLSERKNKTELAENDLLAAKFTPDSQTGKRLMAKCRLLQQENEELGRMISSGRIAKLEGDIALEKRLLQEMRTGEKETELFLAEVDDDAEALQLTVLSQQQDLCRLRDQLRALQADNDRLRGGGGGGSMDGGTARGDNHRRSSVDRRSSEYAGGSGERARRSFDSETVQRKNDARSGPPPKSVGPRSSADQGGVGTKRRFDDSERFDKSRDASGGGARYDRTQRRDSGERERNFKMARTRDGSKGGERGGWVGFRGSPGRRGDRGERASTERMRGRSPVVEDRTHARSPLEDRSHGRSSAEDRSHGRSPMDERTRGRSSVGDRTRGKSPVEDRVRGRSPVDSRTNRNIGRDHSGSKSNSGRRRSTSAKRSTDAKEGGAESGRGQGSRAAERFERTVRNGDNSKRGDVSSARPAADRGSTTDKVDARERTSAEGMKGKLVETAAELKREQVVQERTPAKKNSLLADVGANGGLPE